MDLGEGVVCEGSADILCGGNKGGKKGRMCDEEQEKIKGARSISEAGQRQWDEWQVEKRKTVEWGGRARRRHDGGGMRREGSSSPEGERGTKTSTGAERGGDSNSLLVGREDINCERQGGGLGWLTRVGRAMREGVTEGAAKTKSTVGREQQKGWEGQDRAEGESKRQEGSGARIVLY